MTTTKLSDAPEAGKHTPRVMSKYEAESIAVLFDSVAAGVRAGDHGAIAMAHSMIAHKFMLDACKALVQAGSDTAEIVKQAERAIALAEGQS